jgi:cell division initiation protein
MSFSIDELLMPNFKKKVKGFDPQEVREFLQQVYENWQRDLQEREQLKQELDKVRDQLQRLENKEQLLRETLIAAQKFSSEMKLQAQKEAEMVLKEAELKGEQILDKARQKHGAFVDEIRTLQLKRREMENEILLVISSLKEMIELYREQDEKESKLEWLHG